MKNEEYLDRYGVTAYIKDAVTLMLDNRPNDQLAFLHQYFQSVTHGSSAILHAFRYVRLTGPSQPAFFDNVCAAYASLDAHRSTAGVSGVSGTDLLQLLRLLGTDCSLDVSHSVLLLLHRTEGDQVSATEFAAGVRAGLYYEAFFARAGAVFRACDPHGTGVVPSSMLSLAATQARATASAIAFYRSFRRPLDQSSPNPWPRMSLTQGLALGQHPPPESPRACPKAASGPRDDTT